MVQNIFPDSQATRYNLSFLMKTYQNGKEIKRENFTSADLDNVLPATKKSSE
eukprot:CAMPEP_0168607466 /NCGR_PEP_ID=MMETSP0449_2-20121227/57_1 /TAXON_ID=1082188 /ORGANISM="Strombidium rassoulzadegani, Strain ras09" /LENGTH=51 /DNA_ID=CAMNT_0008647283 /DNA_START=91 /DNA_END=246 /DNA_ORIENTATION=+